MSAESAMKRLERDAAKLEALKQKAPPVEKGPLPPKLSEGIGGKKTSRG